jgi:hypothetical protein
MTLQMQNPQSIYRAKLGLLDRVQSPASRAQVGQIIAGPVEMHAHALIPIRPVCLSPLRIRHIASFYAIVSASIRGFRESCAATAPWLTSRRH